MLKLLAYFVIGFLSPTISALVGVAFQSILFPLIKFNKRAILIYAGAIHAFTTILSFWLSVLIFRFLYNEITIALFWIMVASQIIILFKLKARYEDIMTATVLGMALGIWFSYHQFF